MDVGRLMPFVGTLLFFLPVLWAGSGTTSGGLIYLFSVWAVLIVGLFLISRPISRAEGNAEAQDPDGTDDGDIP